MKYAIAIDLCGTTIKYAVINDIGDFMFLGNVPTYADISAIAVQKQILLAIIKCTLFANIHKLQISGVGIGTPGIVNI